jgi:uncharacterized protein (TIGR02421 family)
MANKNNIISFQKEVHKYVVDRVIFYCSPINLISEKKKFFLHISKDKEYNPQFKYREIIFNEKDIKNKVNELINFKPSSDERIVPEIDNIILQNIINHFGNRSKKLLKLILNRSSLNFTKYSKSIYKLPNHKTILTAKNILQFKISSNYSKKKMSAQEIANKLEPIIANYGWKIVFDKSLTSKMKTVGSRKELVINSFSEFNAYDLTRLKYHEIETHIRRYVNNERLPKEIQTCFNYIETEEGLAITTEEMKDVLSAEQLRIYAGRVLAVKYAMEHSFYEVFKYLKTHKFNDEDAFIIASRVKRGLSDTSKKGGFTRDHIYLSGKIKVDKYLNDGGSVSDLYLGKISIDDVSIIKKILG